MPASLTHHLFAQKALPQAAQVMPFLDIHSDLIAVGTQGPDLFFFYGIVPWRKRVNAKLAHAIGSELHGMNPIDLFPPLWKRLHKQPKDQQEVIASYLFGTMLHYLLDRTVHPYVFYRTGFDQTGELTPPYGFDHARLETNMDVAILQHYQLSRKDYHPGRTLDANKAKMVTAASYYESIHRFGAEAHHWVEGWEDMIAVKSFLYSTSGVKYQLFKSITKFDSLMQANLHPKKVSEMEVTNLLNLRHQTWYNPTTGVASTTSVIELFDLALEQVGLMATLAFEQWQHPEHDLTARWQSFFGNIDHDGHLIGGTKQFFDSMYRDARGATVCPSL